MVHVLARRYRSRQAVVFIPRREEVLPHINVDALGRYRHARATDPEIRKRPPFLAAEQWVENSTAVDTPKDALPSIWRAETFLFLTPSMDDVYSGENRCETTTSTSKHTYGLNDAQHVFRLKCNTRRILACEDGIAHLAALVG